MITQPAQSVTCVTCKCGGVDCSADICPKGKCYKTSCKQCPPPNQQNCNTSNCQCYTNFGFCESKIPDATCTPNGTCSNFCSDITADQCPE